MKNAVLALAAMISFAAPAFAHTGGGRPTVDNKVFATFEEANDACGYEARMTGRDYIVSPAYGRGGFKGWVCLIGNSNNGGGN